MLMETIFGNKNLKSFGDFAKINVMRNQKIPLLFKKKASLTKAFLKHNLKNPGMYVGAFQGALQAKVMKDNPIIGSLEGAGNAAHIIPLGKRYGFNKDQIKKILNTNKMQDKHQEAFHQYKKIVRPDKNKIPGIG